MFLANSHCMGVLVFTTTSQKLSPRIGHAVCRVHKYRGMYAID